MICSGNDNRRVLLDVSSHVSALTLSPADRSPLSSQSWILYWMSTARSYRKVPPRSHCPPCPSLSWRTTSTTAARIPREVIWLEERVTTAYAVPSARTREGSGLFWLLLMMRAPQIQHLHPTHRPQPHSLHRLCCLLTARTQPWAPPRERTSLTCHLLRQEVLPSNFPQ